MATFTSTATKTAVQGQSDSQSIKSSPTAKTQLSDSQSTSYQQSLEFVEVLMLVSFSSVLKLRNLFTANSFEDRDIYSICKDIKDIPSGVLRGIISGLGQKPSVKSKRFQIINRSYSDTTNKLYSWIDGIFNGISRQYIESVQLNIIAEKRKPEHVLESYLFSMIYSTDRRGQEHVGITMTSSSSSKSVTIRKARSSVYTIMNHLGALIRTMPDLPDTRFLDFHIFFTEKRPSDYQIPGFRVSNRTTMLVPEHDHWTMKTSTMGNAVLGSHSIEVKAAYLATTNSDLAETSQTYRIPAKLQFTKLLSRTTFKSMPTGNTLVQIGNKFCSSPRPNSRGTPSTASQASSFGIIRSPQDVRLNPSKSGTSQEVDEGRLQNGQSIENEISQEIPYEGRNSQPSMSRDLIHQDEAYQSLLVASQVVQKPMEGSIQHRLERMARSPSINSRLTLTQVEPQQQELVADSGNIEFSWKLIATKDAEMFAKRSKYLTDPEFANQGLVIRCECGTIQQEGRMISCDCCDGWKHRHCYALDLVEEGKFGDAFACYTCLLSISDPDTLVKMRDVCRLRRVCWKIRGAGLSIDKKILAEQLGYGGRDILLLVTVLLEVGILTVHKDQVSLDLATAKESFKEYGLLHPLAHISHFFEIESEEDLDSCPPSSKKRTRQDNHYVDDSLSQPKKRNPSNEPSTPRRNTGPQFPTSVEVQSPINASDDT